MAIYRTHHYSDNTQSLDSKAALKVSKDLDEWRSANLKTLIIDSDFWDYVLSEEDILMLKLSKYGYLYDDGHFHKVDD